MDFLAAAADLAPGDVKARAFDGSGLRVTAVRDAGSPLFERAYARLWSEFGDRGELERREVLESRLAWTPDRPIDGTALLYEMLVVERGEELVALRDHTAIVAPGAEPIVHLSHVLVEPAWRGTGLAAWLRALPLRAARDCAAAAGVPALRGVTLVAEMEPVTSSPAAIRRLRSYERAGFRKIDPARVSYAQPDFRSAEEIDATGVRPVPLTLVVRRVGREDEAMISGREVRAIVRALHAMFAVHSRPADMAPLRRLADALPEEDETVALVPPTR